MRKQFLGKLFVIGDESIVENCYAFLRVKDWVRLVVTHGVFARGVARVQHRDLAPDLALFDFFLLALFNLELVQVLVQLEEAVFFLVDDHVILQHVLVICDADHGHGELLRGQRGELGGVQLPC